MTSRALSSTSPLQSCSSEACRLQGWIVDSACSLSGVAPPPRACAVGTKCVTLYRCFHQRYKAPYGCENIWFIYSSTVLATCTSFDGRKRGMYSIACG